MGKGNFGDINLNFKGNIKSFGKKLEKRAKGWESEGLKRMNAAVNIVYNTARAKRPSTTFYEFGGETMSTPGKIPKDVKRLFRHVRKVSDPNAKFGVPVRTGNLRDAIKKDVKVQFHKVVGTIWVDQKQAPYAGFIEYGTSKMAKRPFFRPAMDLNRKIVKDIIGSEYKE